MGGLTTSLVNRQISRLDAPDAAMALYQRLVGAGAIEPQTQKWILGGELNDAFPIREDCQVFDAPLDSRRRKPRSPSRKPARSRGPPRSRLKRDMARAISGAARS
jgi:hypothetical protein